MIDGVVPLKWLRRTLERALKVIVDKPAPAPEPPVSGPLPDVPAWESVAGVASVPTGPASASLLRHGATEKVLLSGTGQGHAMLLALVRFCGQPAVVLGQKRTSDTGPFPRRFALPPGPAR